MPRQRKDLCLARAAVLLVLALVPWPLWTSLDGLLSWRKRGGRVDDALGQMLTEAVHRKILAFLQKLIQELPRK